jgi:hypothetical protein
MFGVLADKVVGEVLNDETDWSEAFLLLHVAVTSME